MNLSSTSSLLLTVALIGIATGANCYGTISIVDTFDQSGFSISFPGASNPVSETVNLPLAEQRAAAFSVVPTPLGTTFASTLNSAAGTLAFVVNGPPQSPNAPIALQLAYSGGGPYDMTDCTSFILGFSELSGVGSLYVEFGSSDGITGEHRVDLTGPGDIFYSVSDVKPNSIHSVDSFDILRFVFEARSTEFSFTLDEIRLVPEPSAALLALAAAGLLARRRSEADKIGR